MRAPYYPWSLKSLLTGRPTMGALLDLSEENYRLLMRLVPDLPKLKGRLISSRVQGMDLHLEVQEQTPYTSLIHLTYYFPHAEGHAPDPDAQLRVYHDSRQVDVLDLSQSALPLRRWGANPTLEQRWKINLFLSKWLAYCALQGHEFAAVRVSCSHSSAIEVV
ncbi:MAG: DUF1249 domain-containing protein [Pseudomonadota bacterium]